MAEKPVPWQVELPRITRGERVARALLVAYAKQESLVMLDPNLRETR